MGYQLKQGDMEQVFDRLSSGYDIYGPVRMTGEGMYSDTDVVRYGQVRTFEELEWEVKSHYSFKEAILPITQILFYFTEHEMKEAEPERRRPAILLLRSCDIHAMKRLDQVYLNHGAEDYYYRRLRDRMKLVLMGCAHTCENGFCVSMGTNQTRDYDGAVNMVEAGDIWAREDIRLDIRSQEDIPFQEDARPREGIRWKLDSHWQELTEILESMELPAEDVEPDHVTKNQVKVRVPEHCGPELTGHPVWKEYDSRCIACGRCNLVCPTCTCFTMQDIFYQDNENAGERRRVHASCMVDGYSDVAGGGSCRKNYGERMRFKVLHKISDFKKKFGCQMCVGCGRCDDICPEYISFSACVNKLADMEKEDR